MKVSVRGCAVCAPGLPDWPRAVEVLCGRAAYDRTATRDAAPAMLPPNERRRLPAIARVALGVGAEALQAAGFDATDVATVFTSCGSDGQITHEICESLTHRPPDVSPTRFHNSVHNAPGGYWGIALKSRAPSTSLCAFRGSFAAGLVEAAAQVVTEDRDVLLSAYDLAYPPPLSALWSVPLPFGVALLLSREGAPGGVPIEIAFGDAEEATAWPAEVPREVAANPAGASVPLLSLLARGVAGRVVLPCHADSTLVITMASSAAGPPQRARPPLGERREATQGVQQPSVPGPAQGARPPLGERRDATQGVRYPIAVPPIAALVPHAGAMVLLDEVVACDERGISCRTRSHRDPANPLARDGRLPIWAGIEFAAQAMAAHFALQTGAQGAATTGLFGGLRDVVCAAARLDDVDSPLIVAVSRVSFDPAGSIYDFRVTAETGGRELLRGRATVVQRTRNPA